MRWREHFNQRKIPSPTTLDFGRGVENASAVHGSPDIAKEPMQHGGWRDHVGIGRIHATLVANHIGNVLASHLTNDNVQKQKLAGSISKAMFRVS
jgi:hypothetical protein